MAEKDGLKNDEFRCRICGNIAKVVRNWQRCYPCCIASSQRDTRTYPGICEPCHKVKHPKGLDLI